MARVNAVHGNDSSGSSSGEMANGVEITTSTGRLLMATRKYGLQTVVAIALLTAFTGIVTLVVRSSLTSVTTANANVTETTRETSKIAREAHESFNKTLVDLSGAIKDNTSAQSLQTQVLQQMAIEQRTTNERLLTLDRRLLGIERVHHVSVRGTVPAPPPASRAGGNVLVNEPD